jgi:hypothetical protein
LSNQELLILINMTRERLLQVGLLLTMIVALIGSCRNNTVTSDTPCDHKRGFAYIGVDYNVYIYDVCSGEKTQLTQDAHAENNQLYRFFDDTHAWSKTGQLLVSNGQGATVFDVISNTIKSIEGISFASWSPSGEHLLLISYARALEPNELSVIDPKTEEVQWHGKGEAPVWLSDDEIVFFVFAGEGDNNYVNQNIVLAGLDGRENWLDSSVTKYGTLIRLAWLSPDKSFIVAYGPGMEFQANVGIANLSEDKVFPVEWLASSDSGIYGMPALQWSPKGTRLAICTAGSGTEGANEWADGVVHIIQPGYPTTTISEDRCSPQSGVSWDPTGTYLAYLGRGINIVNSNGDTELSVDNIKFGPKTISINAGPWWSPDGSLIGVAADGQICIAPVDEMLSSLEFDCVVEGSEMAWQP